MPSASSEASRASLAKSQHVRKHLPRCTPFSYVADEPESPEYNATRTTELYRDETCDVMLRTCSGGRGGGHNPKVTRLTITLDNGTSKHFLLRRRNHKLPFAPDSPNGCRLSLLFIDVLPTVNHTFIKGYFCFVCSIFLNDQSAIVMQERFNNHKIMIFEFL